MIFFSGAWPAWAGVGRDCEARAGVNLPFFAGSVDRNDGNFHDIGLRISNCGLGYGRLGWSPLRSRLLLLGERCMVMLDRLRKTGSTEIEYVN